ILLVVDPEVEIGVRDLRILLLRALELGDAVFRLRRAQERKPVVHALAHRVRRQVQRLLELVDRELLGRRVLVEGFAEIAVMPELVARLAERRRRRTPPEAQRRCPETCDEEADRPTEVARHRTRYRTRDGILHLELEGSVSLIVETRSIGTVAVCMMPLGQRI